MKQTWWLQLFDDFNNYFYLVQQFINNERKYQKLNYYEKIEKTPCFPFLSNVIFMPPEIWEKRQVLKCSQGISECNI